MEGLLPAVPLLIFAALPFCMCAWFSRRSLQVIGPVVDVRFDGDNLPDIMSALVCAIFQFAGQLAGEAAVAAAAAEQCSKQTGMTIK
jgi:hypothetical protein